MCEVLYFSNIVIKVFWDLHSAQGSFYQCEELGEKLIHDQDVEWLKEADVVVAEVTQPSLGVGYEIGRAVALNKRILCLFRPLTGRVLSAMIRGAENGVQFQVCDYVEKDLERTIQEYFEKLPPAPVSSYWESTA
uniref:2'-deoxynucleoside 5'-phosphate N-hydrolase 1 n=1 Tax=Latimeria chalumnae TaxID=7897 RepID=H3ASL7_LATCH